VSDYRNSEWTRSGANNTDSDGPPAPMAQPITRPRVSRRHSRSHRSSGSSEQKRKLKRMMFVVVVLLVTLVGLSVATVVIFFKMQQYYGDARQSTLELRQAEGELARAREKVTEMNNDLRILLANRIPGVAELITNRQIDINDQYVRNITFVRSGVGDAKTIEFSTVLENTRTGPILPKVDIVLFDASGLQTGAVRLDREQTVSPVDIPEMQPGETRTYSGQVELQRQTPSKYFVVDVN